MFPSIAIAFVSSWFRNVKASGLLASVVRYAVIAVLFFAVVMLARCDAARTAKKERDHWWRDEIARKSAVVREVIEDGDREIEMTDTEVIDKLGDDLNDLRRAEEGVQANAGPEDGNVCARIPVDCLGEYGIRLRQR